jgi:hypothetical protein
MKKLLPLLTLSLIAGSPFASFGQPSWENDPAYLPIDKALDLKAIPPQVNVNLPRYLLKDAVSELSSGPGGPLEGTGIDFADLIKDVKLIRVVVIEANKTNRPALDKAVKTLRADLEGKWTPIVNVTESHDQNVGIFSMGDPSGESMAGVAVLVYDGSDAVIGNIVGHVSIGKLIKIAMQTNKLPKDLLKKLQGIGDQLGTQPASNAEGSGKTDKPVEAPTNPPKEAPLK